MRILRFRLAEISGRSCRRRWMNSGANKGSRLGTRSAPTSFARTMVKITAPMWK